MRVPWTARRSNQSILKEISPVYSLEGLMLKLKLQYFIQLMQRTDPFEKTLGKIEGERKGRQSMIWLDGITDSMELVMDRKAWVCCSPWGYKESDTTERLNWTERILHSLSFVSCQVYWFSPFSHIHLWLYYKYHTLPFLQDFLYLFCLDLDHFLPSLILST